LLLTKVGVAREDDAREIVASVSAELNASDA
jgi:hypothetical protein